VREYIARSSWLGCVVIGGRGLRMRGRRPLLLLLLAHKMLLRGRDRVLSHQMRLPMPVWLWGLRGLSLRYLGLRGASASAAHSAAAPAAVGRRATAETA
jgi:hypothetical protein